MELKEQIQPFASIPDVRAWYPSESIVAAEKAIYSCLDRADGIALVFGESGLGKTLLFQYLAENFDSDDQVIVSRTRIDSGASFLQQILYSLDQTWCGCNENEMRLLLHDYLRRTNYHRLILLLDEAQTFRYSVFEEIRSLLDLNEDNWAKVRVALAGTSKLEMRFTERKLSSFQQRVVSRNWLEPFSTKETGEYLEQEGMRIGMFSSELLFTEEAKKRIHKYSEGIPRVINQIASCTIRLLMRKAGVHGAMVDEDLVQEAWSNLQQIPLESIQPKEAADCGNTSSAAGNESVVEFGSLDEEFDDPDQKIVSSFEPIQSAEKIEAEDGKVFAEQESPISSFEETGSFSWDSSSSEEFSKMEPCEGCIPVNFSSGELKTERKSAVEEAFPQEELNHLYGPQVSAKRMMNSDDYMEELRLLQGEISSEVEIIKEIRDINGQLNNVHSTAFERAKKAAPKNRKNQKVDVNIWSSLNKAQKKTGK
ncbi:MAG: AAA family ATPase [Planctomycetia bacterium]|nr:AAA family ATPase [Planctomycetia bacterium]